MNPNEIKIMFLFEVKLRPKVVPSMDFSQTTFSYPKDVFFSRIW